MDPLSISASVTALLTICFQITRSAVSFGAEISEIDETITDLFSELQELQTVTENIKSTLDSGALQTIESATGHEAQHWRCVERVLEQCRSTISSLRRDLQAIEAARGSDKVLGRLRALFTSRLSERRIQGYSHKIKSSRDALQISLQLLILLSTNDAKDSVATLSPRLDELMALVQSVYSMMIAKRGEELSLQKSCEIETVEMNLDKPEDTDVGDTSANLESSVNDLANLFDTQCCIDCVRNARTVVSMACTVVSDLENGSVLGFSSLQSIDGRVGGWLENIASSVSTESASTLLQDIDSKSLIYRMLSGFESMENLLRSNALEEAEAQCASLIDDIKSAYGQRYKRTSLFQRVALQKSSLLRKKNQTDEADAWLAFSEKLSTERLIRQDSSVEEALEDKGSGMAERKRATKFLNAIRGGDWAQTYSMLRRTPDLIGCWSRDGETPLQWAAWFQTPDIVQLLLKYSADVHVQSKGKFPEMFTALHHAGTINDEFIAELLLEAGANVGAVDINGRTPLHYAALCRGSEAARSLVRHGVPVDAAENLEGNTALHYAADDGNLPLVRFLIENGAKVDFLNATGGTPLMYAVKKRHFGTARFLIDAGASLKIADSRGKTARDYGRNWTRVFEVGGIASGRRKRKLEDEI
ncbi:Ankyrin-1 [Orbilia brochopaga]|nr:Ankyrin-1 [Drechslerella brochopaga]